MTTETEEFFKHRPQMKKKFEFPGTFRDFAETLAQSVPRNLEDGILKQKIIGEVGRILPTEISQDQLENQLSTSPLISYADHHGLLNYPLLFNSNLLYAEIIKQLKQPYVVVFATGNIPIKNLSYPRGFYFKQMKYNFFKNKQRYSPVYLLDDKLTAQKKRGIDSLLLNYDSQSLTVEEKKFLDFLFFECLEMETAVQRYDIFSDQVTFLNYKLWKYYFEQSLRTDTPDIIYLQSNQIVMDCLLEELKNKNSLISTILFEPEVRSRFIKNFYGIACCWGENMGSELFWGITEKKKFIVLNVDVSSNRLVGSDFAIELERETIINALLAKKILPTIFIDFLIITFMGGYLALGGFNQIDFLPQMQQAHIKTLEEIGMHNLSSQFATRITDGLICGMMPFDFNGGIDLIWHHNSQNGKFNGNLNHGLTSEDLEKMRNMKTKEMILSAIGTMMENITEAD